MAKQPLNDTDLERLFSAARYHRAAPSSDLMARILANANVDVVPVVAAPRTGFWATVLGSIGGWPAAAGLATAAVTGLAVGFDAPETLDTLSGWYFADASYQLEDLLPSYGDLLSEG